MSKNKWTQGKWKAFRKPLTVISHLGLTNVGVDPDRLVIKSEIVHPDGDDIALTTIHFAEVYRCGQMSDSELEANAHLIAAAPAMAEALENLLVWVFPIAGDNRNVEAALIEEQTVKAAFAALSLARGETK